MPNILSVENEHLDPRHGPLFKYMQREHLAAFTTAGTVRIGTLHEYHAIDRLGEQVGDSEEGMVFCLVHREDLQRIAADISPCGALASWVRNMVRESPEARLFKQFFANYMARDQYAYCVTETYSDEAMRQLGYDACLRIDNPLGFFGCISEDIAELAASGALFRCQYRDRLFGYEEADVIHPESVKTPRYAYQKEVRALWASRAPLSREFHPIDNPAPALAPMLVSDSRLIRFCTPI